VELAPGVDVCAAAVPGLQPVAGGLGGAKAAGLCEEAVDLHAADTGEHGAGVGHAVFGQPAHDGGEEVTLVGGGLVVVVLGDDGTHGGEEAAGAARAIGVHEPGHVVGQD